MGEAYTARKELLMAGGDSSFVASVEATLLAIGDVTGATGVAEWKTGINSVSGTYLSEHERNVRGIVGGFGVVTTTIGGARVLSGGRVAIRAFRTATGVGINTVRTATLFAALKTTPSGGRYATMFGGKVLVGGLAEGEGSLIGAISGGGVPKPLSVGLTARYTAVGLRVGEVVIDAAKSLSEKP